MKALLICPDERIGIAGLAESAPLANVPLLGKSLIEHWLEFLAAIGAKEILVLASDRADEVRALVSDGVRWGLRVKVITEVTELTPQKARAKYCPAGAGEWLPAPYDALLIDHLPGLPQVPLIASYADWFAGALQLMPDAMTPDRIGVHELTPRVWVGLHTHIAADAKLIAPCWIGEKVWVESGAIIGPNAILEREVFVSRGSGISESIVGPETFVGQLTEVHNSIAWGSTLINWHRDSYLRVPDEFLLCSLEPQRPRHAAAKAASPAEPLAAATVRFREFLGELVASVFAEAGPPR